MTLDAAVYYRALQARDPRFDGRIYVAVQTTGIYCRPICPARTPKRENIVFYASAAAAQEAGFRPCLRCRPESSPELAVWQGTSSTVARALALIADGALEGDDADVESFAARLGIGDRHLRRLFQQHLGASPLAVAQTRRILFAKKLVHETDMRMSEIAMAAGFGSVRRFNATFRELFARPPMALRRRRLAPSAEATQASTTLSLSYAPPYDWEAIIGFLRARAIAGVELVEPQRYRRTIAIGGCHGTIDVAPIAGRDALSATIHFPDITALPRIVARVRRVFDLGADVRTIGAHLARDRTLARLVARRPGLRVPGAWDGFELGVRAVLGQQITVSAARKLAARLVDLWGEPVSPVAVRGVPELSRAFPTPQRLAAADFSLLGLTRARSRTLAGLAAAVAADPSLVGAEGTHDLEAAVTRLRELHGIGDWTAQYIALRALRDPDAFPASDIGLLRALTRGGTRPHPTALLARAEAWRPWRAYAAQHLWTHDADGARPKAEADA